MGIPFRIARTEENASEFRNPVNNQLRHGPAYDIIFRLDTAKAVAELVLRINAHHGYIPVMYVLPVLGRGKPVHMPHGEDAVNPALHDKLFQLCKYFILIRLIVRQLNAFNIGVELGQIVMDPSPHGLVIIFIIPCIAGKQDCNPLGAAFQTGGKGIGLVSHLLGCPADFFPGFIAYPRFSAEGKMH